MEILIVYDDTQRTLDSLERFNPDFDFELLLCRFATSGTCALEMIQKHNFEYIIIAGQSVDNREDMSTESFVPYNFLYDLRQINLPTTQIYLVSPDKDFLNKGKYLAEICNIKTIRTQVEVGS